MGVAAALSLANGTRQGDSATFILGAIPDDDRRMQLPMYVHATMSLADSLIVLSSLAGSQVKMRKTVATGLGGYPTDELVLFSALS